jgi:Lecithin retinol acyltransferase
MNRVNKGPAGYKQVALDSGIDAELPLGCWLVTPRRGYSHHGVYVGSGWVVHYAGLSQWRRRGPVELVTIQEFAMQRSLWIKWTPTARYIGAEAAKRALSRLGENRYRVVSNNCEHFCAWCLDGESRSRQIDRWLLVPRFVATVLSSYIAPLVASVPRLTVAGRR